MSGRAVSDPTDQVSAELATAPRPVWLAPLVLLILALGPWPYGYFMLLRLVVCGAAAWLAYSLLQGPALRSLGWTFVGIALLFNPVFKIHFERETWMALNVLSAVPFALYGWKASGRSR